MDNCIYCNKKLVKFNKNNKTKDWDSRKLHKKCVSSYLFGQWVKNNHFNNQINFNI